MGLDSADNKDKKQKRPEDSFAEVAYRFADSFRFQDSQWATLLELVRATDPRVFAPPAPGSYVSSLMPNLEFLKQLPRPRQISDERQKGTRKRPRPRRRKDPTLQNLRTAVANMARDGLSSGQIAEALRERDYPTPPGVAWRDKGWKAYNDPDKWTRSAVRKWISNAKSIT